MPATPQKPQNQSLQRLRTLRTHDIDEQAALLHGWNQTYNQISGGAFSGTLTEAEFDGLYVFREVTSQSLHQTGALPADRIAVGVPLSIKGAAKFCGQSCDGTQAHIFSGANGFEYRTPEGLDMAGAVVSEDVLRTILLDDEAEAVALQVRSARLKPVPAAARDRLRSLLIGAMETLQSDADYAANPILSRALSADAARAVIECLTPDVGDTALSLSETRCIAIVREAQKLAGESAHENLSVEDICRTLNVSRRTLQASFQRALGVRPSTYLRAVRLNAARRTLKECGNVTAAASAWGFWHFGRFSQDYKSMFGEHPSETVRRHFSSR